MSSVAYAAPASNKRVLAGRVASTLAVLFLLFDTIVKLLKMRVAVEGTTQLGYPESVVLTIGIIQLACLVTYMVPSTAVLGAVLLTGYLGGAVATHVRVGSPLLSHILFPVYVGVLVWGGIYLREDRLRALLPFRTGA